MSFDSAISLVATVVYPTFLVLFFFGLTIFIHELGHFLVAKWRGMKIERFSVGFGPKIWGYTKDGVDYRISWFPFGGYVALPQMSPMETIEGETDSKAEDLPYVPPRFKFEVALAGPIMNVLLAALMAGILWYAGMPTNLAVVGWVDSGSPEELAGIRPGDRIVQVNDQKVKTWSDFMEIVAFSREPSVKVVVNRGGQQKEFLLETKLNEQFGVKMLEHLWPRGHPFAQGVLADSPAERAGLKPGDQFVSIQGVPIYSSDQLRELIGKRTDQPTEIKVRRGDETLSLTVVPELNAEEKVGRIGVQLGDHMEIVRPGPTPLDQFSDVLVSMGRLVKGIAHSKETGVTAKNISGPVGILTIWWLAIVSGGVREGLHIAVLLNINLAIINLLPFPILDGGHIVFAGLEAIRRKPLSARIVHATSMAFAFLLIGFMLYITFFDIQRLTFTKSMSMSPHNTEQTAPATNP
ncbi:MAG TPA: RIP metalloprotease RseP [Verrucomicrobiae bacterium]|nr:RIP metalloprotease RseP [Verrucomicrobiae bacterium]